MFPINFPINVENIIMDFADESVEDAQKDSLRLCLDTIKKLPDGWYKKYGYFYERLFNDYYSDGNKEIDLDTLDVSINPNATQWTRENNYFIDTIKFYSLCNNIDFVEPEVCTTCTCDDYPCSGYKDFHHFCH
jgi:hypothetical protein